MVCFSWQATKHRHLTSLQRMDGGLGSKTSGPAARLKIADHRINWWGSVPKAAQRFWLVRSAAKTADGNQGCHLWVGRLPPPSSRQRRITRRPPRVGARTPKGTLTGDGPLDRRAGTEPGHLANPTPALLWLPIAGSELAANLAWFRSRLEIGLSPRRGPLKHLM
jgi:hypothetical protein